MDTNTSFASEHDLPADWPTDFPPFPELPADLPDTAVRLTAAGAARSSRRRAPRRIAAVHGIGPHVALYYLLGFAIAVGGLVLIGILGALLDWLKAIVP